MWEAVSLDPDHSGIDHGPPPADPAGHGLSSAAPGGSLVGPGSIGEILAHLDEPGGFLPDLDRDGDRLPDTACFNPPDGLVLATDVDGDGRVDVVTTIDRVGDWHVFQRSDRPDELWESGRSGRIE